jgi:hypothetical protein
MDLPQARNLLIRRSKAQRLPSSRRIRIKHRLLRQTRHSRAMPRLKALVVIRSVMHRDSATATHQLQVITNNNEQTVQQHSPIIPQRTRPRRPIEPHLNIDVALVHLEQILQNRIALARIQPDDPHRHGTVHEKTFPARHRVDADKRMAALDVLGPCVGVLAVEVGVCGTVDGVAAVDDLAEFRRQLLVGGVARGPERVAADFGDGVVVQVGYAGWLALVGSEIDVSLGSNMRLLTAKLTDRCASLACRWVCGNWLQTPIWRDQAR